MTTQLHLKSLADIVSDCAYCAAGINFVVDDSLPGAVLKLVGQDLIIRDSTFSNLASGADGTLIALNSSIIISNTTFSANAQAAAGALFLNGSRATVFNSLFDRNRGGLSCYLPVYSSAMAGAHVKSRL